MADPAKPTYVEAPLTKYRLSPENADLALAAQAAHELVWSVSQLVYWLTKANWHIIPLLSPEGVLGRLVDEIDRKTQECATLNNPLFLEFAAAGGCYSEGSLHASCAAEAALRYTALVRQPLDLAARIVCQRLADGHLPHQYLPASELQSRWAEIVSYSKSEMGEHILVSLNSVPDHNPLLARLVADVAKVVHTRTLTKRTLPLPAKAEPPTIWHHGERSYSPDKQNQFVVTEEEDSILTVFREADTAKSTAEIADKSGVTNVSRVVAQLVKNYGGCFAAAIRNPGAKGAGGYYIRVRPV